MTRVTYDVRYIPSRRGNPARQVRVERRDLSHRLPVILESYGIDRRPLPARVGPLAREVTHMLRAQPARFPDELRSDR